MSRRRKRFIHECARSTTHRRALKPAMRLIALASSPRGRTCAVKPNSVTDGVHLVVVVAGIQAHPLGSFLEWLWPLDHQTFDRRAGQRAYHAAGLPPLPGQSA